MDRNTTLLPNSSISLCDMEMGRSDDFLYTSISGCPFGERQKINLKLNYTNLKWKSKTWICVMLWIANNDSQQKSLKSVLACIISFRETTRFNDFAVKGFKKSNFQKANWQKMPFPFTKNHIKIAAIQIFTDFPPKPIKRTHTFRAVFSLKSRHQSKIELWDIWVDIECAYATTKKQKTHPPKILIIQLCVIFHKISNFGLLYTPDFDIFAAISGARTPTPYK